MENCMQVQLSFAHTATLIRCLEHAIWPPRQSDSLDTEQPRAARFNAEQLRELQLYLTAELVRQGRAQP